MSTIRPIIFRLLLDSPDPLSFPLIKLHFQKRDWSAVGKGLHEMHDRGLLERTGEQRHYRYALTPESRQRLIDAGTLKLRRHPRKRTTHVEHKRATSAPALQPCWPASTPGAQLTPSVGLPWADEDELPPVIGERYVDVMHQIGHE
jgi:hypothetical protein